MSVRCVLLLSMISAWEERGERERYLATVLPDMVTSYQLVYYFNSSSYLSVVSVQTLITRCHESDQPKKIKIFVCHKQRMKVVYTGVGGVEDRR